MMRQRRDAALGGLRLLLVACIVLPVALFCYVSWRGYLEAFERADEGIERALDVASEQALRVLQSITVVLDATDQIANRRGDAALRDEEAEINGRLKQFTRTLPDIASIWLLDAHGDVLVSSLFYPLPAAVNAPDRDYLKAYLAPDAGLHVGPVLRISLTGKLIFPISRQRLDAAGRLLGYTLVSISPQAFERFYAPLAARTSASFALINGDSVVLARFPVPDTPGIRLDATTGFGQLIARSPSGGRYTAVSSVDGVERRYSVRRLPGFPLYVSSSLETRAILRGWVWDMAAHLVFGLPATLLLIGLIILATRRTQAFYAEASRREAVEASLRQSQKMEAVGQLTGGVAHDFNNLLTIILGNLQLALPHIPDGKPRKLLVNVKLGAERAAELTKRLLAFSRSQPLNPKSIDLNAMVAGLTDLLDRTLGEAISVETVRAAGLWRAEVDAAELESAILNLAINARDAMPDGGKLTLETGNAFLDERYCDGIDGVEPGQYVMLSVTDTGSGMAKDVAEKSFEPFFTTKPAGSGTGLGLSQVYGLVKQSGGHIRIYSEVGEGTTVKIYLPRTHAAAAAETPPVPATPVMGNREHVVVVEDDPEVRDYVAATLRELNYTVTPADSGEAALAILEKPDPVDLLLTDVVMPGMNGRVLSERVQVLRPGLKVLFMTGYSRNAIVHQGRLDPGVVLIQKPFSQDTLASQVRKLLAAA